MSAAQLMTDLARLEIHIEAHGDWLRCSPKSAVTPDLVERMKAYKPELLVILAGEPWEPEACHDYNEWCWQAISDADRDYLLGPRNWPDPCPWCGGRMVHGAACNELRREWVPILPFGKHRGRRADDLPADYIDWILTREVGSEGFRDELRRWRETK